MSVWTTEMDDFLRAKWAVLSSAEIGLRLNKSRNAVIGRAHRLGLERIKPKGNGRPKRPRGQTKGRKAPRFEFVSPPAPVAPLNIKFIDLEPMHCREIVGSEGFGMSLSCGHPVIEGESYCPFHSYFN